jgi:XTP/dITP diphosphohydrolase
MENTELLSSFTKLYETITTLRKKCPWDSAQTPETIRPLTIEEAFELSDAILKNNPNDFKKELGDVLLHIILYAVMEEEKGNFNLKDVFEALNEKLVFRHPHIFGGYKAETPEEVSKMWEEVKLKEKNGNKTVLGGIPKALPSIIKAYRISDKASASGFDWHDRQDVWKKVKEEISEFEDEVRNMSQEKAGAEFGDVLFALINAGRLFGVNADTALERTNQKFIYRFNYIEQKAKEQGKELKNMTLAEMEALWNEAKLTKE